MDNKVLGKGLSALISQANSEKMDAIQKIAEEKIQKINDSLKTGISPNLIDNNPFQPRQDYDEKGLEELQASIKEKGILQPILVRPSQGGRFQVVAGERRLRAARALNLVTVPVVVKDIADNEVLLLALIENIQRQDLNVIDEAKAFEKLAKEFNLSHDQIAKAVGKDRATISNTIRLLKLPLSILQHIIQERISMGHARALLSLESQEAQLKMAQDIISQNLSVRLVEGLVNQVSSKPFKKTKAFKAKDQDIANLEEELRGILGSKVSVEDKKGKGKVIIEYYSLDDLDRILNILRKK
jgi:ParB family chromosome partitioning protein